MEEEKNQPIERIPVGRLEAAIWENRSEVSVWHTVTFSRRYRDGEESKHTSQFPHRRPACHRTAQPRGVPMDLGASEIVAGRE